MKLDPSITARLASLQPNHVDMFAWWQLAGASSGGIPGQPDPDPQPNQPTEPGEPTLPDEPPPAPVA